MLIEGAVELERIVRAGIPTMPRIPISIVGTDIVGHATASFVRAAVGGAGGGGAQRAEGAGGGRADRAGGGGGAGPGTRPPPRGPGAEAARRERRAGQGTLLLERAEERQWVGGSIVRAKGYPPVRA